MASCTVRIRTDTSEPSQQEHSQDFIEQEFGAFYLHDDVKQAPADHYVERKIHATVNRTVGLVKLEADDDIQGYTSMSDDDIQEYTSMSDDDIQGYTPMSEHSGLIDSVKCESTNHQTFMKMQYSNSMQLSKTQRYTCSRIQSYKNHHLKFFESAINVVVGTEGIRGEDNLINTSNEESEMKDDSYLETLNDKTCGLEMTLDSYTKENGKTDMIDEDTKHGYSKNMVSLEEEANINNNEEHTYGKEQYGKIKIPNVQTMAAFGCSYCPRRFETKHDLNKHTERHIVKCLEKRHNGKPLHECGLCPTYFRNVSKLHNSSKKHLNIHEGVGHTPKMCGKSFARKATPEKQVQYHNDISLNASYVFPCLVCKILFTTKENFDQHMQIHTVIGLHTEILKGLQVFRNKAEKTHEGSNKYPCDQSNRIRHQRRQHQPEDSMYMCDLCPKGFRQKYRLKNHHLAVHLGQRPHPCPHCSKGYHEKYRLKRHIERLHSQKLAQLTS